jgi:starch-binding outer membrane protein, SusD/RagB family
MTFHRLRTGAAAALAAALVAAAACSDTLKVASPSRIDANTLEQPTNAKLLVTGAISDFECAFGAYIVAGGLIGDELMDATQTADRYPYEQRTITSASTRYSTGSCTAIGTYSPLQTARVSADNIRRLLEGWTDAQVANRQLLLAQAAAYEGYSQLLLGEGFCGVVFSHFNADKTISYGSPITPAQAFDSAITQFTEAINAAQTAGVDSVRFLALVGRARAKLDKGDLAGARADAVLVPANFVYYATASTVSSRRNNRVWADNGLGGGGAINSGSSVGPLYRNLNDPRVPVTNTGKTAGGTGIPIWVETKYTTAASPIRLATGDEAQLIIAEADIKSNAANTVSIVDAFRAKSGGSETPYAGATDSTSLIDAIITERRRSLFLESQHLGDFIRYNLPFNPAPGTTFYGGGQYGSARCMPLPDVEIASNPNTAHP